nr:hypothetical protein [Tanacetum cinerariifolium]
MEPKQTTRSTPVITTPAPKTTTSVTNAQLQAMIDQGVTTALATRDANRNGDDSHTSGKGNALTWWNSYVKTTTPEAAHAMPWRTLKKMMTDKYCPRELALMCDRMFPEEIDKVEKYVDGLPDTIHGSVMATKPKTMQDAIEFATKLMNKKINTWAECQADNKIKSDDTTRNNHQQPNKRQNTGSAYAAGNGKRKEYAGTLPLCNKCKFHHNGQCTIKNPTCYEYGNQGHYRSDCLELKNQDHGNQVGGRTMPMLRIVTLKLLVKLHNTFIRINLGTFTLHHSTKSQDKISVRLGDYNNPQFSSE